MIDHTHNLLETSEKDAKMRSDRDSTRTPKTLDTNCATLVSKSVMADATVSIFQHHPIYSAKKSWWQFFDVPVDAFIDASR